jgi:hypothetical protein
MRYFKGLSVLALSLALTASLPVVASAAKKKKTTPKVKLFTTKTLTTTVPTPSVKGSKGRMILESQLINAKCGRGYQPLSIGIVSATSSFVAQDLGFVGMSVYADGVSGTAKNKLQALCVKGGKSPSYIGKSVVLSDFGGDRSLTASLKCGSGRVALGAALAHGHAPALGAYRSMPDGTRKWSYSAYIDSYNAAAYAGKYSQLGYPRAACVAAKSVTRVEYTGMVAKDVPAEETVKCKSGRTLGWGVEEQKYRSSAGSDGRWTIPVIEQAKFVGTTSMHFKFSRGGDTSGFTSPTPVKAVLICGKLPKG